VLGDARARDKDHRKEPATNSTDRAFTPSGSPDWRHRFHGRRAAPGRQVGRL